ARCAAAEEVCERADRARPGDPAEGIPEQEALPRHPIGAGEPGGDDPQTGSQRPKKTAIAPRRANNTSPRSTSCRLPAAHRPGRSTSRELRWRATPREVAQAADVVFSSLPGDSVLEDVASGPEGILTGLTTGKIWVDMSTISPRASRRLAERVRTLGATFLDAPVSGSVPQVQAGTLTIMVGGSEKSYARVEPLLRELGSPKHIGENGQGLVLKLAINISLAVQMLAFAEGLLLAERA